VSAEFAFVLAGAWAGNADPPAGAIDWDQVLDLALSHRVLSRLARQLPAFAGRLSAEQLRRFQHHQVAVAARRALQRQELGRVLAVLRAAGTEVLVYKGPAISAQVHGGPDDREYHDLDLLVRPSDFAAARAALLAHGYRTDQPYVLDPVLRRSECDQTLLNVQTGVSLEVHWAVAPPHFALALPTEDLFRRRVAVTLPGGPAFAPSLEDLLVLLALNGTKDGWARLETILTIARLLSSPSLDLAASVGLASHVHAARLVRIALLLAQGLTGVSLPSEIARAASADAAAVRLAAAAERRLRLGLREGQVSWSARMRLLLGSRERWRDRAEFCARRVLTPTSRDVAAMRLPAALWPAYFLVRPVRLMSDRLGLATFRRSPERTVQPVDQPATKRENARDGS
jgi:hypothetical protein